MQTKLIQGVPVPAYDKDVLSAIAAEEPDPYSAGGPGQTVGVCAPDGRVYRAINTEGLGEHARLCIRLGRFLRRLPDAEARALRCFEAFAPE